jgi:hypothetical protein
MEAATDNNITVSWSAPITDNHSPVTGYRLYMNALNDGDWTLVYDGKDQPTVLTHLVPGLQRGLSYRFMSSAINYVGEGANSTEATLLCAKTPSAPGQPQYVSSTSNSITIAWSSDIDNGGAFVDFYEVFYKLTT